MNDPTPTPEISQESAPETAPAGAVGNFGATLRAAREVAGISVPTLAGRLRLHVKQIEALERSDLAALPTLIYVRGFVRSCARELKIDVAPLLEDLDRRAGVVPGAPLAPAGGSFHLARLGDGSRSIVAIGLVVLVIAGVIGTVWPRRVSVAPQPAVAEAPPPSAVVPAPETREPIPGEAPAAATAPGGVAAAPAPVRVPGAMPPSPLAAGRTTTAAPLQATDAAAPGSVAPPAVAPSVAPTVAPAAGATAPVAATPGADAATLVLHVHASSWVEVVQANGTSVFSQICPAGSIQTVHGTAPLRIVIGNAGAVEAQYRGVVVDLNRYANANGVARFTLE